MRTNKKNNIDSQKDKKRIMILNKIIKDLNEYTVECYNYNKYLYDFIINNKSEITPEHFNGITSSLNSLGSYSASSGSNSESNSASSTKN